MMHGQKRGPVIRLVLRGVAYLKKIVRFVENKGKSPFPYWWDGGRGWVGVRCPKGHGARFQRAFVLSNGRVDGVLTCPHPKCGWFGRALFVDYWDPYQENPEERRAA